MNPRTELASWKEIANYLQVTIRTAQRWELERQLPVKRMPGNRSRVYISLAELEIWKATQSSVTDLTATSTNQENPPASADIISEPIECIEEDPATTSHAAADKRNAILQRSFFKRRLILLLAVLIVLAVPAGFYFLWQKPKIPATWAVFANVLTVSDADGHALWRHKFAEDLHNYSPADGARDRGWFGDLNGDGNWEFLFGESLFRNGTPMHLLCFSHHGDLLWEQVFARNVLAGTQQVLAGGWIRQFLVAPLGKRQQVSIVVVAAAPTYPCQIILLNSRGEIRRSYWHSGHFGIAQNTLIAADVNRDGANEIMLLGINNSRKMTTLLVLDPDRMEGAAVESNPDYQIHGFRPGREMARLFFPRSCLNLSLEAYNAPLGLILDKNGVTAEIAETAMSTYGKNTSFVNWHLNPDLTPRVIDYSDGFKVKHLEMEHVGILKHSFNPKKCVSIDEFKSINPVPSGLQVSSH